MNQSTNLFGVVNVTAKVAFILDINANIITLLDGNNGAAIVFNLNIQQGNYIAPGQSDKTWIASKVSFEVYFNSLVSLKVLLNIGTVFSVQNCPQNILKVVAGLLVRLSVSLAVDIEANSKVALEVFIRLGSRLSVVLTGSLKGILQFAVKGIINLNGDFVWLVGVLEGLGEFFGHISGGLAALIKARVQFDLAVLLGAASGLEVLVNLIFAIIVRFDLSVVADILNNVDYLLEIVVKLGGGVSYGVTGLFKIVALVVKLINKKIQIEVFIQALLEFAVYRSQNSGEIDLSIHIEGLVQLVEVIKSSHGSTSVQLKVFFETVEKLKSGNLIVGQVNISHLMKVLAGAIKGALEFVVTVLILLGGAFATVITIPYLLFVLLKCLNTAAGIRLLVALGILASTTNVFGNILVEIVKSVNLSVIIRLIATGFNLDTVLKSIPIVKDIYAALTASVKSASSGSLSVSVTIQASGSASVTGEIKTWIQSVLNIDGHHATSTEKSGGGIIGGIIGGFFGKYLEGDRFYTPKTAIWLFLCEMLMNSSPCIT